MYKFQDSLDELSKDYKTSYHAGELSSLYKKHTEAKQMLETESDAEMKLLAEEEVKSLEEQIDNFETIIQNILDKDKEEAEEMPETAQEANTAADAPDTAPGSACAPSPPTEPATPAEWVDRVEACGCTRRVQMAGPRGTWALGYLVRRCEGHSGGRR
jgi:hypothetical protein